MAESKTAAQVSLDALVKQMHDRFNNLMEEGSFDGSSGSNADPFASADEEKIEIPRPTSAAKKRWDRVRGQMLHKGTEQQPRRQQSSNLILSAQHSFESILPDPDVDANSGPNSTQSALHESDILLEFWGDKSIPQADIPTLPAEVKISYPTEEEYKIQLDEAFDREEAQVEIVVSKVPAQVLASRRQEMEENVIRQKSNLLELERARALDVIWREHQARERINRLETVALEKIKIEQEKLIQAKAMAAKSISRKFKLARNTLEDTLRAQNASILETYGKIGANEVALSRKYVVRSRHFPQPIEARIHLLRAIKTKLPKGAYLMMLTQYESLGGKPLSWSKAGLYGIGEKMPAVTRPVKHYGRYFDRTLRVEDSCFALCPPAHQLKPSYVLVFELFQLANRTCPNDRVVAWTALPMCGESLTHIDGKFKLPMIRGEHTPSIRHFKAMEECISQDLNNWLCNVYVELKHLPLADIETSQTEHGMLSYDYIGKSVITDRFVGSDAVVAEAIDESNDNEDDIEAQKKMLGLAGGQVDAGLFQRKHRAQPELDEEVSQSTKVKPVSSGSFSKNAATAAVPSSPPNSPSSSPKYQKGRKHHNNVNTTFGRIKSLFSASSSSKNRIDKGADMYEMQSGQAYAIGQGKGKAIDESAIPLLGATEENSSRPCDAEVEFEDDFERDEDGNIKVLERGYDANDDFFLDDEQRGRLLGVDSIHNSEGKKWAAAALEEKGSVQRRWQSEGPRFDSEAFESITGEDKRERGNKVADAEKEKEVSKAAIDLSSHSMGSRQQSSALKRSGSRSFVPAAPVGDAAEYIRRSLSHGSTMNSSSHDLPQSRQRDSSPDPDANVHGNNRAAASAVMDAINESAQWRPLESAEEMELFTPAVAADPSKRKRLLPGAISKSKLRYLYSETFGELSYYMWGTFDFYITVGVYLIAFWLRMYLHYIGEYLFILALSTPVYSFQFELYQVQYKYMSSSISIASEIGIVSIGPLSNIIVFLGFAIAAKGFYKFAGFMPKGTSQFVLGFGLAVILDPMLVMVVDLCKHNFNCASYSAQCKTSYTSSACKCFVGDFAKLWTRMATEEGSGLTGLLLLIIIYGACFVISCLLVYEYLVYVHHDGKIVDLWRRIHGQPEDFHIPDDFEISFEELSSICARANNWHGLGGQTRKLVVSKYVEHDPLDPTFEEITTHYAIYEIDGEKKSVYRHFLKLANGAIIEVFDQFASVQASRYQALHKLLNIDQGLTNANAAPAVEAKRADMTQVADKASELTRQLSSERAEMPLIEFQSVAAAVANTASTMVNPEQAVTQRGDSSSRIHQNSNSRIDESGSWKQSRSQLQTSGEVISPLVKQGSNVISQSGSNSPTAISLFKQQQSAGSFSEHSRITNAVIGRILSEAV